MVLITDLTANAIPSDDQIKAGQNGYGDAVQNENIAVSLGGTQTFTQLTGLSSRTDYALYFVHEDAIGNTSEILFIAFNTLSYVADIEETFPDNEGGISSTAHSLWTWDDEHVDHIGWDAETIIGSTFEIGDDSAPHVPDDPGGINPT